MLLSSDDLGLTVTEGELRERVLAVVLPRFIRGDANQDGGVNVSDAPFVLLYLFAAEPDSVDCEQAADTNRDDHLRLDDAIYLVNHLFQGGAVPPSPYPGCGLDRVSEVLTCEAPGPCMR